MTDLTVAINAHADVGEAPFWDGRTYTLTWVDILAGTVHSYRPASDGTLKTHTIGQEVGAAVPRTAGGLVLAVRDGIVTLDPSSGILEAVAPIEADNPDNRMNDAACDPMGRLWAGTCAFDLTHANGALYRVEADGEYMTSLDHVTLSNGIAWSPHGRLMYYTDSLTQRVDVFDYDLESGSATHRRPFVEIPADAGLPDGLTVDSEGGVWVALWDGGALRRYDAAGILDRTLELPVQKVTNCVFGGPDLETLYITTGAIGLTDADLRAQPHAGSVFSCRPGVAGLSGNFFGG